MQELIIAQGTPQEFPVLDVREDFLWSFANDAPLERAVYYHHTVDGRILPEITDPERCLEVMRQMATSDKFRLPYNFLLFPHTNLPPFYLNDIDRAHPHTFGHNGAVAIAAQGNYDIEPPPQWCASRMGRLTWALATMWDIWLPERFHRDVFPTACPGRYLAAALIADGSYSG